MVKEHYRWDFIGLSTDEKPTPETSEKVVDGSTFYCSDTSKLYVFCQDEWYEKKPLGEGGGGGDTVYSTKTTSNSATGGAVYIGNLDANQQEQTDPTTTDFHTRYFWALPYLNTSIPQANTVNILGENVSTGSVVIGSGSNNPIGDNSVVIGGATSRSQYGISLGYGAYIERNLNNSVALGSRSIPTRSGEVNIGHSIGGGYNSTNYRVIGGVHDGQLANDAVTVGQINALIDAINTATGSSISHIGA